MIQVPSSYIHKIIVKGKYVMLGAFCEYARDCQSGAIRRERDYAIKWLGSDTKVATAHRWIVEFKNVLEAHNERN